MLLTQLIFSFLAISQLLFTSAYFLIYHHTKVLGRLYALYSFCLLAYVADNLPVLDHLPLFNHLASAFAILSPGVFWAISRYYFQDKPTFSLWIIALIPGYTLLRLVGVMAEGSDIDPAHSLRFMFFILPNIIMLGFAGHIIQMVVQGRNADLVDARRSLRLPFALIMAVFLVLVIGIEMLLLPNSHLNNVFFALLFVLSLSFNLRLPGLAHTWLAQLESVVQSGQQSDIVEVLASADTQLIARLREVMSQQRYYSRTGLTITELAKTLEISEHHLRKTINHQLHYRNFNQYLNFHRISEASQRLLAQPHLPILTIALDVGYRSVSSFNKAFLARHQVTPSQYRQSPPGR